MGLELSQCSNTGPDINQVVESGRDCVIYSISGIRTPQQVDETSPEKLQYIARNLFLDGNTFESSRHVTKMNLVGDISFGAAVTFDAFRLAFTRVIRSREYKTQAKQDQFGAVDLTFRF